MTATSWLKRLVENPKHTRLAIAGVLTLCYAVVVVRSAWITDDAYISLRTVDNMIQGLGLRWNAVDRVQSFTHPLWVMLLSLAVAVTREIYVTTIVVSIALAVGAYMIVIACLSRSIAGMVTGGLVLLLAPGYVTFSTSGLENPLSFLLVAAFLWVFLRRAPGARRSFTLAVLTALIVVNRADLVLLVLPAVGFDLYRHRHFRAAAVGLAPAVVWFAFSLVYYGFLLPNTAYSKLSTGIALGAYVRQGMYYLLDSLKRDTLAMVTIVTVTSLVLQGRHAARRALAAGIVLYVGYVVRVGGDFMLGRLLAVVVLAAVALLLDADLFTGRSWRWGAVAAVVAIGLAAPAPTFLSGSDYGANAEPGAYFRTHGIASERDYYFSRAGLINGQPLSGKLGHDMHALRTHQANDSFAVKLVSRAGENGLSSRPGAYVIDDCALGDALLARLPIRHEKWRIGHFFRVPPSGYLLTLATGENHIRDPGIREYYEHIRRVTRAPLFDGARWASIVGLNLGRYSGFVRGNAAYEPIGPADYLEMVAWNIGAVGPRVMWGAAKHHCEQRALENASPLIVRLAGMERPDGQDYVKEAVAIGIDAIATDAAFSEGLMRLLRGVEPADAEAAWGLAVVLYQTNRIDEAIGHMQFAARLGHGPARQALEKLGL